MEIESGPRTVVDKEERAVTSIEALMEAVVMQARTTWHPWLVACDANCDFRRGLWFEEECMCIEAPEAGVSTCRSTGPNGELFERTYDWKEWRIFKATQGGCFSG